jgi:putative membrane protein
MWAAQNLGSALLSAALFGVLGIALTMLGYKCFDWITPRLDLQQELAEKGNIAVAIVVAAVIIGTVIVVVASIS